MKVIRGIATLALMLTLTACAANPSGTTGRSRSNVLTAADIAAAGHSDAFNAVQSMRPQWLRVRGATTVHGAQDVVQVYLDGSRLGGPEQLRAITTSSISTITYYDGLEATQRYGLGHGGGAIVVSTRSTQTDR